MAANINQPYCHPADVKEVGTWFSPRHAALAEKPNSHLSSVLFFGSMG
jgi:hypothetical protein